MAFTISMEVATRKKLPELNIEIQGMPETIEVTYRALGINFGGKRIGDTAEIMFEVTVVGALEPSLICKDIEVGSMDGNSILLQAEQELLASLK